MKFRFSKPSIIDIKAVLVMFCYKETGVLVFFLTHTVCVWLLLQQFIIFICLHNHHVR